MINSELLKEAIADAKAVRVTAYANARASLQERFDKRFEAVFAEKLKNEAQEEEEEGMSEDVNPTSPPQITAGKGEATHSGAVKAIAKGKVKKVSDASTNWKVVGLGGAEGATGAKAKRVDVGIDENTEEEEEGKKMDEQYEEEEEGKMDEAGFTSEDLDEIIKELEAEVAGEEEGRHVQEPVEVPHAEEPAPEVPGMPGEEPHDDDDDEGEPHGHEGDEEGEPHVDMPGGEEGEPHLGDEEEPPVDVTAEPGAEVNVGPEAGGIPPHVPGVPGAENQEEINLEELLAALNEDAEEEEEEEEGKKMDEITNNGLPKNVGGQDKHGGTNVYPKGPDASKKQLPGKNHNIQGKGNIGSGAVDGKPLHEVEKYKVALKESYKTIEFLRGQINEVNLLNAKLLYTNKLFKEFATVIDEPYRMKIVEAFDLTKTVREVKLAYALLAESLNFGSKRVAYAPARPTQKVDPARRAIVKQITEGQASKPVGSTKPAQEVINEDVRAQVARLQKLAGIKLPLVDAKKGK